MVHEWRFTLFLFSLFGLAFLRTGSNIFHDLALLTHGIPSPRLRKGIEHTVSSITHVYHGTISSRNLTSSYNAGFCTPSNLSPSHNTPAVIPLPQLVTIGRLPWMTSSAFFSPIAFTSACRNAGTGRNFVYALPFPPVCVSRKVLKGRENAWGICPEERPGRGSGSLPVNLQMQVYKYI